MHYKKRLTLLLKGNYLYSDGYTVSVCSISCKDTTTTTTTQRTTTTTFDDPSYEDSHEDNRIDVRRPKPPKQEIIKQPPSAPVETNPRKLFYCTFLLQVKSFCFSIYKFQRFSTWWWWRWWNRMLQRRIHCANTLWHKNFQVIDQW